MKKRLLWVVLTGVAVGIAALALSALGNPGNMGFCIACFIRDTAGAVKMHSADVVQYARPEIVGLIIGGLVGLLIGRSKDRGLLGLILGALLGCIGWVIIAIIPAKDRRA